MKFESSCQSDCFRASLEGYTLMFKAIFWLFSIECVCPTSGILSITTDKNMQFKNEFGNLLSRISSTKKSYFVIHIDLNMVRKGC